MSKNQNTEDKDMVKTSYIAEESYEVQLGSAWSKPPGPTAGLVWSKGLGANAKAEARKSEESWGPAHRISGDVIQVLC